MAKKIILVHGLGGSKEKTWGKFPELIEADHDLGFSVILAGYKSPSLINPVNWFRRAPSIANIANGLITEISARCDLQNDEIVLVGHSLGGVVVKKALLILENKGVPNKIRKVCFFDVPHDGSGYANIGNKVQRRNRHLSALCRDSSELDDLNDQWVASNLSDRLTVLSVVAANDGVVSSSSSKSIFRDSQVETINDVDHLSIVKPEDEKALSYIVFKRFVLSKNNVLRYAGYNSRDFHDWRAVERNHSFNFVSDDQRKRNLEALVEAVEIAGAVVRLTGASGLGKSRILIEAIVLAQTIDESSVLIFDAPGYENAIRERVRCMVDEQAQGLVVVENCSVELHNHLASEVKKTECNLKVVTVGYADDQVESSIQIRLAPLSDDAVQEILMPILSGMDSSEVSRIAKFAQGYPLMATLIAEQYQKEGRLLGSIEASSVIRKLIEGNDNATGEDKTILSACSLFDVFGTSEGEAGEEARFIAEDVAGSTRASFDRVLKTFAKRQIIHRAGRYARVVPKPLALTLAAEWWEEASTDRQKLLIETLPESLLQSFCTQVRYLDDLPSVQRFSDRLFLGPTPFVPAEELLTERGSKLFRAFVEVNPGATSDALYMVLAKLTKDQLKNIKGNVRRNLVWGLEKLCFRETFFSKSAWSLLLLASEENETWSNNATGVLTQLFRLNLSGTQAPPSDRFALLERALARDDANVDLVVTECLSEAISTRGHTRTIGAEFQGTKAKLEEWRPRTWIEAFDYWGRAFDLLLDVFKRGEAVQDRVKNIIGYSIRDYIRIGRLEILDNAIKKVVAENGPCWPEATDSLQSFFRHDAGKYENIDINLINSWVDLLNPENASLSEKLKIIVTNAPSDYVKDDSGNYVNLAEQKARALAKSLARDIEGLVDGEMDLLFEGSQNQAYAFGWELALEANDLDYLINSVFQRMSSISTPNTQFLTGVFKGLFQRSRERWEVAIAYAKKNPDVNPYFVDLIGTGKITNRNLDDILTLAESGVVPAWNVRTLAHGGRLDHLDPATVLEFSRNSSCISEEFQWAGLDIVYMYCFSRPERVNEIEPDLRKFILDIPLHRGHQNAVVDFHQWSDLAGKLLETGGQSFALALVNQILSANSRGIDYGALRSYVKPLLKNILESFSSEVWPVIGDAVCRAKSVERLGLNELLEGEQDFDDMTPGPISFIPVTTLMKWCEENRELGPVFIGECVNVFYVHDKEKSPSDLFVALLEKFGDDEKVSAALARNLASGGWSGSLIPYLESDKAALMPLTDHSNPNVREWVQKYTLYLDKRIEKEAERDDEMDMGFY